MSESPSTSGRPACWWRFSAVLLALSLILPVAARAEAAVLTHCTVLPDSWIADLDPDDRDLIHRRTCEQCRGAARWIKEQALDASETVKQRICRDLVLIWTYKECEYQRDYIDRRAYQPCMVWSREMHRRCLADDLRWFDVAPAAGR